MFVYFKCKYINYLFPGVYDSLQETRFLLFFLLMPAFVHALTVGLHAGYPVPLLDPALFLPQGTALPAALDALQSTQPLPLFLLNHFFRPSAAITSSWICCPSS
jgi:hypothetical protein